MVSKFDFITIFGVIQLNFLKLVSAPNWRLKNIAKIELTIWAGMGMQFCLDYQ